MITVLIVAILAAIAYPSYQSYLARAYRSEAYTALNHWANLQEQYFLDQRHYAGDMTNLGAPANPFVTDAGHYRVQAVATATGFTLTATALDNQLALDSACPTLTLSSDGVRAPADCWR
jgi:type IV pilus assembly protein PilE